MTMLKLSLGASAAGWLVPLLLEAAGRLRWDNPLLWAPPALFMAACLLGLEGIAEAEHRLPLLLAAALGFASVLLYGVGYVFLFALSG